jgi:hypothetical protein
MRSHGRIERLMKLKTIIISADRKQLFFIFAAFAMMVVCSYFFAGRIIEKHIALNAEKLLDVGGSMVRNSLREIEVALLNMEAGIQSKLTDDDPREQVTEYLTEVMSRLTRSESGIRGVFNFYAHIDDLILVKSIWAPDIDPERPWGLAREHMRDFVFSPPVFNENTGFTYISALKAFYRTDKAGRRTVGIVGMDIDISHLFAYVKTFMSKGGGYGMLLDRNFNFIIRPGTAAVRRSLEEIGTEYKDVFLRLKPGQNYVPPAELVDAGGEAVMAFFQKLENQWFFGIAIPTAVYYEDLRYMSEVLAVLGLMFMLIISASLLRLSAA